MPLSDFMDTPNSDQFIDVPKQTGLSQFMDEPKVATPTTTVPVSVETPTGDPSKFYGKTAVSPPFQGLAPMIMTPEITTYLGKLGVGPRPEGGWSEAGVPLDKYGRPYTDHPTQHGVTGSWGEDYGIYNRDSDNFIKRGFNKLKSFLGSDVEPRLSEEAKAQAVVQLMASDEGVPLSEYRQSPELIEKAASGFTSMATFGVIPALRESLTGEVDFEPTDLPGYIGYSLGSLGGLIMGPFKASEKILHPVIKYLPRASQEGKLAARILVEALHDSIVLGPAMGLAQLGEAYKSVTFSQAASHIWNGVKSGALTGAIFGAARGMFPAEGIQKATRMITGLIGLNALRAVEHGGNPFTNRPVGNVIFDTLLDVYFLYNGLPKEFDNNLNIIDKLSKDSADIELKKNAIDTIPDDLVRQTQEKVLEAEKKQVELRAAELAKKVTGDLAIREEIGRQADDLARAKVYPVEDTGLKAATKTEIAKVFRKTPEELANPEATFKSKKGNEYVKKDGVWYRDGVEVTNKFVIKAAEKGIEEQVTEIDTQTGTPKPESLQGEKSPFFQTAEEVEVLKNLYNERPKVVESDPELLTQKLINDVNRWYQGDDSIDIETTRNVLSTLATKADDLLRMLNSDGDPYFITGVDHLQWKETVTEAADWARSLDRIKIERTEDKGTKLYSGIPLDKFGKDIYKIMKDIIERVRSRLVTDTSTNERDILENIMVLQNAERPIEADFTYSKGVLWKNLPKPIKKFDLNPQTKDVIKMDVRDIKLDSNSIESAFIDPPFLITPSGTTKSTSIMAKRFTGFESLTDMIDFYKKSLKGLYDVIKPSGILVIKTQNITPIGGTQPRQIPVTSLVSEMAMEAGFKPVTTYRYINENAVNFRPGRKGIQRSPRISSSEYQVWEKPARKSYESPIKRYEKGIYSRYYSGIPLDEAKDTIIKGARKIAEYTKTARGMKQFKPGTAARLLRTEFTRNFVDRSGNIRRELLDQLGDEGYEVIQKMYLSKGASSLAANMLKQMRKEVYGGLERSKKKILDDVIFAARMVDIAGYKSEKQFKFPKGMSPADFVSYLELFRFKSVNGIKDLTESEAHELYHIKEDGSVGGRAGAYYDWMKKPLKDMHEAGLLTDQELTDLSVHNYRRIKLVDLYDKRYGSKVGATKRTIYDSGVEALARGRTTDVYEPSSEVMALEVFNRAYGRILNQAANKTLLDLARKDNENPFVRVKDKKGDLIPSGWSRLFVYDKGERKTMWISPEMSKEWITNSPEMSYRLSQFIRIASGSPILRTFATGINWGFALANLPRDVMHTWFAARAFEDGQWKPIYSSTLPIYGLQIGRDLATVFSDSILRKGRYEDYIKEGGGMEFLVHQGRILQRGRHLEGPMDAIYNFMGYFGETSEIMTRLAIRERMLHKGKDAKEATFAARDYMDFGQGGGITKALDNAFPYLNATVVATRGILRSFKDNPASSVFKLSQLAALTTGLYIAMQQRTPKTAKQLKNDINMQNNICIPLGDDFGFEDENGQMRYPYLKIPLDQSQRFFKKFFEASADKWLGNEVDVDGTVNALESLSPVGISSLPPTVSGTLGYVTNKDFWRNEDIWRKTDKPFSFPDSKEEYIPGRTPQAFIDLGAKTGLSPERTKHAVSQLVTNGTLWSYLLGECYDVAFGDLPKSNKEQHLAEVLAHTPVVKRFFGITNPYAEFGQKIDKAKEGSDLERWIQNRGLDARVQGYLIDKNVERKEIIDYIKSFKDKDVYDRLKDRFEFQEKTKDLPNKSFWLRLKSLNVDARAKVYVDRLETADDSEKAELRKELAKVIQIGGVVTPEFREEVMKLRSK